MQLDCKKCRLLFYCSFCYEKVGGYSRNDIAQLCALTVSTPQPVQETAGIDLFHIPSGSYDLCGSYDL